MGLSCCVYKNRFHPDIAIERRLRLARYYRKAGKTREAQILFLYLIASGQL
jgi:hypothetical protein